MKAIKAWGVRQNNLKDIEVEVPLNSLTVICGPSGSGKSSLAFETLYAEGQRRYIESLSNYTKQFLNKAPKPDIDGIENIPPSIAIEQKNSVKSSRSTVGTSTEIVDFLRLIYEKIGTPFCPDHEIPLEKLTVAQMADVILEQWSGQRGYVLVPVQIPTAVADRKKMKAELLKEGFLRVFVAPKEVVAKSKKKKKAAAAPVDFLETSVQQLKPWDGGGDFYELQDPRFKNGVLEENLYIIIDRLGFSSSDRGRLVDSLSQAFKAQKKFNPLAVQKRIVLLNTSNQRLVFTDTQSCVQCGYQSPPMSSRLFSFNSPLGACPECKGFGNVLAIDEAKVIPNPNLTLAQGAIKPFSMPSSTYEKRAMNTFCKKMGVDLHTPWKDLPAQHRKWLWQGHEDFFGVKGLFEWFETKKYKMHVRIFLARHKSPVMCPRCHGSRLRPEALRVLIGGKTIAELSAMTVKDLREFFRALKLKPWQTELIVEARRQLEDRLDYLLDVGVGYLSMDRPTKTLSGGEFQRLNLANQLGLALSQTLYVLDEPTVGLHPRDNDRLIRILKNLNAIGNTLVVVEHDPDVILNATHIIEMGPGSGHLGGEIIFNGEIKEFLNNKESLTAHFLRADAVGLPFREPKPVDPEKYRYKISLQNCTGNNLKKISASFPLNRLVVVTGVSGSGKSSLVTHTLYPALARQLGVEYIPGHEYGSLEGVQNVKGVLLIDQSPIGKTARSNPATYLKIFDSIRAAFSSTPEAKAKGYTPGTFSLNVDGGRCPVCKGVGYETIDMLFMDDIEIPCDACDGKRYQKDILEITFRNRNIADVLKMTVSEAMDFFVSFPNIWRPLSILKEMGLDYLCLGQSANSLSGGESQRLKIVKEFNSTQHKGTLYILDEPTTGRHFREVHLLMKALHRIIEGGGSVVLVEHNLEVIRQSDYIIDIGPDAGDKGGEIVFEGTPEELVKHPTSFTGHYLRDYLERLGYTLSQRTKKLKSHESRLEKDNSRT